MLLQANVLFSSAQVVFLNDCISPLQHWVPSSVLRGLTKAFCKIILIIKFTHLSKTPERQSQRYEIYIHKGTAIPLKPAMLQYNRVQSVPFMQISLTNVTPLPEKLRSAQGVYPSLPLRGKTRYYFISSKGILKKYIKCFFFLPKLSRHSKLFLMEKKVSD